jgi:hypothetical protein
VPLTLPESRTAQKRKTKTNHERINPQKQQQESKNLQSPSQKQKKREEKTKKRKKKTTNLCRSLFRTSFPAISLSLQLSLPSLPSRPASPTPPDQLPVTIDRAIQHQNRRRKLL